jgi:Ca2+-binding EF-hand superfamily protein
MGLRFVAFAGLAVTLSGCMSTKWDEQARNEFLFGEAGAAKIARDEAEQARIVVTFAELEMQQGTAFDNADSNKNGFLDESERRAVPPVLGVKMNAVDWGAMDRDGDGKISRREYAEYLPPAVVAADANWDQALNDVEVASI